MSEPIVLVLGGTGFVGRSVIRLLQCKGYSVSYSGTSDFHHVRGAHYVPFEKLTQSSSKYLSKFDVVINCMGSVRSDELAFTANFFRPLEFLTSWKSARGARKSTWIQLSSVGVYGTPKVALDVPTKFDSSSDLSPENIYELSKAMSDRALEAVASSDIEIIIIRAAAVVCREVENRSLKLLKWILKRRMFFYVNDKNCVANYIHRDDVASALVFCLGLPRRGLQIYNLSSDCLYSEIFAQYSRAHGLAAPKLVISRPLASFIFKILSIFPFLGFKYSQFIVLSSKKQFPLSQDLTDLGYVISKPMPQNMP